MTPILLLEEQREFIEGAQDILDELVLPREGKLNGEVELDIQKTIKEHSCIYIPVGPYWHDVEINIDDLKNSEPFTLEVLFPGMSKVYLFFYDKFNKHIGIVANPYIGIYEKDYYLDFVHFRLSNRLNPQGKRGQPVELGTGRGFGATFRNSSGSTNACGQQPKHR
jgi:hypothetical protein